MTNNACPIGRLAKRRQATHGQLCGATNSLGDGSCRHQQYHTHPKAVRIPHSLRGTTVMVNGTKIRDMARRKSVVNVRASVEVHLSTLC